MGEREHNLEVHQREMAAGAVELRSLPLTLQIEPTSVCNLECKMCGRQHWDASINPPGEMPERVFDKVRPMLPHLLELVVGGYAEATLARSLFTILAAARDASCPTRLITNGTRMDDAMCRRLIEHRLAHVVLSIDGAREETNQRLRGIGAHESLAALERLAWAAGAQGAGPPAMHVSFTAMRSNVAELAELVEMAADRGVTEISVGHVKIYAPELAEESLFLDTDEALRCFDRAAAKAEARSVKLNLPRFDRRDMTCLMPFQMLFVKWSGKVLGCCSAVFENDKYSFPVGDLSTQSLAEIWNSAKILSYRRAARGQGEYPEHCRTCAFRHDTFEAHLRPL